MNYSEFNQLFGVLLDQMSCPWKSLDYKEFLTVQRTILVLIEVLSDEIKKHPDRKAWPNDKGGFAKLPDFLDLISDFLKSVRKELQDRHKEIICLQKTADSLRSELAQYRTEIEKLQSKTSSLTSEILSLKRSLAKADHKQEAADKKLKDEKKKAKETEKEKDERIEQQDKEIAALKEQLGLDSTAHGWSEEVQKQAEEVKQQAEEIKDLKEKQEISDLEKKLDHTNTSNSSSRYPNHSGVFPERESSGKSRGAQKGHQGAGRKTRIPTSVEYLPNPRQVQEHPEDYMEIGSNTHNRTDLVFSVETTGVVQKVFRNIHTGKTLRTPFPKTLKTRRTMVRL